MNKLVKELSKIPTSFNHNERRRACFSLGRCYGTSSSSSGKSDDDDTFLSRNYIVKNWLADMTRENNARHLRKKRNAQTSRTLSSHDISTGEPVPMPPPPPLSQSATGLLKPTSPEEFKVAPLLARANLIVTRNIEWANLMVGFEQENRYAVVDAYYPQAPVGFISEQSSMIARQEQVVVLVVVNDSAHGGSGGGGCEVVGSVISGRGGEAFGYGGLR
ncbi:hypothetical protein IFM89_017138 [Coptis chinensis]|uniref:Phospholipid scramblase n=1 Tax=Coptis chinensis TaxID=261450 RepID=A0A835LDX5_9MAGN|nr:hypothetical protein IFM89_017138 [Coptis chinensis]